MTKKRATNKKRVTDKKGTEDFHTKVGSIITFISTILTVVSLVLTMVNSTDHIVMRKRQLSFMEYRNTIS